VSAVQLRTLTARDADAFEAFLVWHRDSSMFLRSNVRRAGFDYQGQHLGATYVAAFVESEIVGVIGHAWNGMLLVQAPTGLEELATACVRASGRAVKGFSGPSAQVRRARQVLGLSTAAALLDCDEALYALDLDALVVPAALSEGTLTCRRARSEEQHVVGTWRHAYLVEVAAGEDSEDGKQAAIKAAAGSIAAGHWWLAFAGRQPVALAGFNASLPDIVQLGGVYTPPELRNKGYARAAVAGCLLDARAEGATRAVLFTENPSAAHAYEALGFKCIGAYGLVMLK
jgi:GNAT superfamily N-acetyltransferase